MRVYGKNDACIYACMYLCMYVWDIYFFRLARQGLSIGKALKRAQALGASFVKMVHALCVCLTLRCMSIEVNHRL